MGWAPPSGGWFTDGNVDGRSQLAGARVGVYFPPFIKEPLS